MRESSPFQCRKILQPVPTKAGRPVITKFTKKISRLTRYVDIEILMIAAIQNIVTKHPQYAINLVNLCCELDFMKLVGQFHNGLVLHLRNRSLKLAGLVVFL